MITTKYKITLFQSAKDMNKKGSLVYTCEQDLTS